MNKRVLNGVLLLLLCLTQSEMRADLSTTNRDCLKRFWDAAENRQGPVTVLSFGDSMADGYRSIAYVWMNQFATRFGMAGFSLNNYRNAIMINCSEGAHVAGPSKFWFTDHLVIPTGGSVFWESQPAGGVLSTQVGLFYVTHPEGGMMEVSLSTNSGPWSPKLMIDAYPLEPAGRYTNLTLALNRHRLRVDGISGTNYIIGPQLLNTLTNGVHSVFCDKGGIHLGQVTNVARSIREPILAAAKPDLIVWHMKEDEGSAVVGARMLENEAWFKKSAPQSDVLYIGTPWKAADATHPYTIEQNRTVRSVAVSCERAYVDCATPAVSYDWMLSQGYMADGTHLNVAGSTYLANVAWEDLNFFALRQPRTLSVAHLKPGWVKVQFSTGLLVNYVLEGSKNLVDWQQFLHVQGDGSIHETNVSCTNSSFVLRLQLLPQGEPIALLGRISFRAFEHEVAPTRSKTERTLTRPIPVDKS